MKKMVGTEVKVSLNKDIVDLLIFISKRKKKSVSNIAKMLMLEALKYREDMALYSLVKTRDSKKQKRIGHHDVWKRVIN